MNHAELPDDPQIFWDNRYSSMPAIWSGNVNSTLASVVTDFQPGRALDLGAGEGGDAIWLAQHGWQVTGVELSPVAVERAQRRAAEEGLGNSAVFIAADLTTWQPPDGQSFDLVTASFFQSPVRLERISILRSLARHISPGRHLVVVSHAAPPSWHNGEGHDPSHFRHPKDELADLDFNSNRWEVERCEVIDREAVGPEGQHDVLKDGLLVVRASKG